MHVRGRRPSTQKGLVVAAITSFGSARLFALAVVLLGGAPGLFGLNPGKSLTQYTRTVWTQAQGLPQDTIRSITQTSDSYLWLGTDEGLSRFDGYEFVTFTKDNAALPSNSIAALWPGHDGGLWIGTPNGLVLHRKGLFKTFTTKDGLPDNAVTYLREDHSGTLWIVAGGLLCRFQNGRFTTFPAERLAPANVVRVVYEDREQQLWIAGESGLMRRAGDGFSVVFGPEEMRGNFVTAMLEDHNRDLWLAGAKGLMVLRRNGTLKRFDSRDGLPNNLVRALWEDRSGNLWAGTDAGFSRFVDGRFVSPVSEKNQEGDWVKCLFEDREGNLWVGMNSGLNRFRDDPFTTYGRPEGLPSDAPLSIHQDRSGQMWVGYHDVGLVKLLPGGFRAYTSRDGLAGDEVFSIRESRNGDLLIATRYGFSRMHQGRFITYAFEDPMARSPAYDALETSQGRLLVARASGVHEAVGRGWRSVIPGGAVVNSYPIVLSEGLDGDVWAGTYGIGLWQLPNNRVTPRLWTMAEGLSSNQIRSLYQDREGTLWIGTFGGGLTAFRGGVFSKFTAHDGLLSDNISHVEEDGNGNLWLSTTRGICRVAKQQLRDFSAGRVKVLTPDNYSVEDGLRSAQSAPGYPIGGGGARSRDGRLWFSTSRGLATVDPGALARRIPAPYVQMVAVDVDGRTVDSSRFQKLEPGTRHIQFRYAAIHLSAPEQTRYAYKLEGLDDEWISAGNHRVANYNTLKHGRYRFVVQAILPAGVVSQSAFQFEVMPNFYERAWFVWLCGALLLAIVYLTYQLRLARVHSRFSLVLEERMRLAREVHDTLAQGFVGIGSQLAAVTLTLENDPEGARHHLDVARKMATHSLTEARRSVMDLRTLDLDEQDLPAVLISSAQRWVAGTPVHMNIEVSGDSPGLPQEVKQNLLRIAQEAVANTLKHASAKMIWVKLDMQNRRLRMRIKDDGRGFEPASVFSGIDGHFGLLGMRERAKRLGGELDLASHPGEGTIVEVTVPI
jgi:signal transduction histidine kinase/ligand-binding sensor domain-containing protein